MHDLTNAVWIELRKATRSRMPLFTALGFLVLPCGLAFFMFIYKYPTFARNIGLISAKANLAGGAATWPYYLGVLGQAIAIGGIAVLSLVESWVFGREFACCAGCAGEYSPGEISCRGALVSSPDRDALPRELAFRGGDWTVAGDSRSVLARNCNAGGRRLPDYPQCFSVRVLR